MGKSLDFVLLVVLFATALGIAVSRENGTDAKPVLQCNKYECLKLGCPCKNGICSCDASSVKAEPYSRTPAQHIEKARHQCNGDCKFQGNKVGSKAK
ncbi:hypothetical protein BVRB_002470 isoform B [Beta vulgaris subsp. vulgaris]|uniref:Uncharacterized protein n=1 Tax=Beta vulgaris subsp. vulgaris TaxID=3555 RepID=A0A0J8B8C6_BETVV|nr:hypothetical protein BVRB_002470 isoform A [Beta vulgaris subsp. vulgaris]KMS96047.1 hypothetical protein BVRB_002470 isoform B [Beta vulgaris subsp. vulgaris]